MRILWTVLIWTRIALGDGDAPPKELLDNLDFFLVMDVIEVHQMMGISKKLDDKAKEDDEDDDDDVKPKQ